MAFTAIPRRTLERLPPEHAHIYATNSFGQQPRQMLLILRSTVFSSASIAASSLVLGPVADVPPGADRAEPVVTPEPVFPPEPVELAVPELLVPGGGGEANFDELPAPLGSLPELFNPPTLAGPDGTPLVPAVPAPAEPAFGEPAALPAPVEGPLAAPPALPPLAPPPLCAPAPTGEIRIAIAVIAAVTDARTIENLLFDVTVAQHAGSGRNDFHRRPLGQGRCAASGGMNIAQADRIRR